MMIYESIYVRELKEKTSITKREDVYRFMKGYLETKKEQLILITLDSSNFVIGTYVIHVCSINSKNTDQRDIVAQALFDKSKNIILCRVLEGDEDALTLSHEDRKIAEKFYESCKLFDINIVFQLFLTEYGYSEIKLDPNNNKI